MHDGELPDFARVISALIDLGELTTDQILLITDRQLQINEDFSTHYASHMASLYARACNAEGREEQERLLEELRNRVTEHAEALYRTWSEGHRRLTGVFASLDDKD